MKRSFGVFLVCFYATQNSAQCTDFRCDTEVSPRIIAYAPPINLNSAIAVPTEKTIRQAMQSIATAGADGSFGGAVSAVRGGGASIQQRMTTQGSVYGNIGGIGISTRNPLTIGTNISTPLHINFENAFESWSGVSIRAILKSRDQVQHQVNPVDAINQADKMDRLNLSPSEVARGKNAAVCSIAYKNLVTVFVNTRPKMGKFWLDSTRTLNDFIGWYYSPDLSDAEKEAAAPVVSAQIDFSKSCLDRDIPQEINGDLIKMVVGIISFGNTVMCSGLRNMADEVLTARHCFMSPDSGKIYAETQQALEKKLTSGLLTKRSQRIDFKFALHLFRVLHMLDLIVPKTT